MRFVRLTVVEMRRAVHRRLVRWMVVIAVVLCAVLGLVVFLSSSDPGKFASDGGSPARMVNWWRPGGGDGPLLVCAMFLVVGAAICGASVAVAERRTGTMTTMLTWVPSRVLLHAARTTSAALLSFAISFVLKALCLGATLPAILAHDTTAGTDSSWWATMLLAMSRISFVSALIAVLAVSVATIGRNTSAALVAMAGWALLVERLVAGFWPKVARFMIAENVAIVVPCSEL